MFLNINTFKKKKVVFNYSDDYFTIDGEIKRFEDVCEFYCRSTEHFTNYVYEGESFEVKICFSTEQECETHEVDSNHEEDYSLLHRIAGRLETFRADRLTELYRNGRSIIFPMWRDNNQLCLGQDGLFFKNEPVQSIVMESQGQVTFALPGRNVIKQAENISDQALFKQLAAEQVSFTFQLPKKRNEYWSHILYYVFVLLGINGWVDVYFPEYALFMDYELIDWLSGPAAVWLVMWHGIGKPVFWGVGRLNKKKKIKAAVHD